MCKKTQCAKGLQALSIRGYTLQLYLDNFILGYAGLSFINNKEKDGLYMNQTSIIPNHVSENAIFDKDTGWRIDIPSCIEPGTRVLCLYRVSTDKQLYQTDNNEADIPMQRSPVVGTNVRHSGRSRDSGAYDSGKHNNTGPDKTAAGARGCVSRFYHSKASLVSTYSSKQSPCSYISAAASLPT